MLATAPTLCPLFEQRAEESELSTSAIAIYDLTIDVALLSGSIAPVAQRIAQSNDDLYLLSLEAFLKPSTLQLNDITRTATTLDIGYSITHPFPACADPVAPATASNRADLGFSGVLLMLADAPAPGNTYFTDRVLNTTLLANADAYLTPAGLLNWSGTANTFPYKLIVDELYAGTGNRIGLSNSGQVAGNFGADGWTRSELGVAQSGWYGYGVLHQGQAAANTLSFNLTALGSTLSLQMALIAKYNDPRGGATPAEQRANRLPAAVPDAAQFAYRMPHGALDVDRILVEPFSGNFRPNQVSAATLSFHVQDWDARAITTSEASLDADPVVTHVAPGEAGIPALAICIPGVLGDSTVTVDVTTLLHDDTALGGDPEPDGGYPGDALCFSQLITKPAGSGQIAGDFTGVVRATDPETALAVPLMIALDSALRPLSTNLPSPISYQAFRVTLAEPPIPSFAATWSGPVAYTGCTSVAVGAQGESYIVGGYWGTVDFDPGAGEAIHTSGGFEDAFCLALSPAGDFRWIASWGGENSDGASGISLDSAGSLLIVGSFSNVADFDPGIGTVSRTSAWGHDAYLLALSPTGAFQWVACWGGAGDDRAIGVALDITDAPRICGAFQSPVLDFDPGVGVDNRSMAGEKDAYCLALSSTGTYQWADTWGGSEQDEAVSIALTQFDEPRICGDFQSLDSDFDPGATVDSRVSSGEKDAYCLALGPSGAYQWAATWGAGNFDTANDIALTTGGALLIVGRFQNTVDFDPGLAVVNRTSMGNGDVFCLALSSSGTYLWDATLGGTQDDSGNAIVLDELGAPRIVGQFRSPTMDFNPGPAVDDRPSAGVSDAFCLALDQSGAYQWAATWGGLDDDFSTGAAQHSVAGLRICGSFQSPTVDFDPGAGIVNRSGLGTYDAFTLALQSDGTF